jgi:hypothetical protein
MIRTDDANIAQELRAMRGEVSELFLLAYEHLQKIDVALEKVEPATAPPAVIGIDPELRAGPLAREIWERCGRRKAAVVRTRINQLIEAEDGKRSPAAGGSTHRVVRPGNGAVHVA